MPSMIGVATTGLLASQRALGTLSHNISNVNTEGYSRQRVDFTARLPQSFGNGFLGNGTQAVSVSRNFDEFLEVQVINNTSASNRLEAIFGLASQMDNLFADADAGLGPSLQSFFNSVQEVADDPASIPARQVMLSDSQTLSQRFEDLGERLLELRGEVTTRLETITGEINSIAASIAKINNDILTLQGRAGGNPPNDLMDQRNTLIAKLAEKVAVTTVKQDDGALNIFIGNGQPIVLGSIAGKLSITPNTFDPSDPEISFGIKGISAVATNNLTGGELGGVLELRSTLLEPAMNALGRIAISLADTFNAQHSLGQDLTGALGGDYFLDLSANNSLVMGPQILGSSTNTGNADFDAVITDTNALGVSDYRMSYDGTTTTYTLVRLSDNSVVDTFAPGALPRTVTSEGFQITLASGTPANGDIYLIRPTRNGALDFNLAVTSTNQIAAAGPLRTAATISNLGTAGISAGNNTTSTNLPMGSSITLTYDATNGDGAGGPGFSVAGGPAGLPANIAYNPTTDSAGASFTFTAAGGFAFDIDGVPQDGDSLVIANNANGVGDNRNALALAELQNKKLMSSSSVSYQDAYSEIIVDVGSTTRQADINRRAQAVILDQALQEKSAVSGVNLEEEAANLLKFQQAFQAAAQVIAMADTLFQTLLGAVER